MRPLLYIGVILVAGPALAAVDLYHVEPEAASGSSQAVVVGDAALAHTAQVLPLDDQGRIVGKGDAATQVEKVLDNLQAVLKKADSGLDRTVKLNVCAAQEEVVPAVRKALAKRFPGKARPAVSFVVGVLSRPDALVSADAVAVSGFSVAAGTVKKLPAAGEDSPVAILPAGPVVYVSGQAEKGATLAEATRKTLAGLRSTLRFLSLKPSQVVQVKSFVHPMAKVADVRGEMTAFFGKGSVPPLVFVEWQAANSIEIELIAAAPRPRGKPLRAVDYLTPPELKASPIFSRVARINYGKRVYVGGQYGQGADGESEVKDLFASLGETLKKAGSDFRHLVKATYYVSADEPSRQLNAQRPRYYDPKLPPAASKATVAGTGLKGRGITLDMIAVPAP